MHNKCTIKNKKQIIRKKMCKVMEINLQHSLYTCVGNFLWRSRSPGLYLSYILNVSTSLCITLPTCRNGTTCSWALWSRWMIIPDENYWKFPTEPDNRLWWSRYMLSIDRISSSRDIALRRLFYSHSIADVDSIAPIVSSRVGCER